MTTESSGNLDPRALALIALALVCGVLVSAAVLAPNAPGGSPESATSTTPLAFRSP